MDVKQDVTKMSISKPELLAPAGDMEKLRLAVLYGADAVYLGASDFSLRAQAHNFDAAELAAAVDFAHASGVKVYLAVNVYAHEQHLPALRQLLPQAAEWGVDAFIIADPGIFRLAGELAPGVERHISTQAASSNSQTAQFWLEQGASRVVLAREVSLAECGQIARAVPIELEIFVHGAVCMAYSGRCLLSSFLCGRGANLGDCAQPCRWQYRLEEAKRPGQYMPIEQDKWGSYIFNSKDLRLLELLPEILLSGAASLKIEGRMKSAYYVANVTRVYRHALDACWEIWQQHDFKLDAAALQKLWQPQIAAQEWGVELDKLSQRQYFTGFALAEPQAAGLATAPGAPGADAYDYDNSYSQRVYDFAGLVLDYDAERQRLHIEQRNHLRLGDEVEFIQPQGPVRRLTLIAIWSEDGAELDCLPHAKQHAWLACPFALPPGSILRRPQRAAKTKEAADE